MNAYLLVFSVLSPIVVSMCLVRIGIERIAKKENELENK